MKDLSKEELLAIIAAQQEEIKLIIEGSGLIKSIEHKGDDISFF